MTDLIPESRQSNSTDLTVDQTHLDSDILVINSQLNKITLHSSSIETAIEDLHVILSSVDKKQKSNIYRVINELRVTLSTFMTNTSKLLDLKLKYRTQQAGIKFSLLKVISEENTAEFESVMKTMHKLAEAFSSTDTTDTMENNAVKDKLVQIKTELDSEAVYNLN